MLSCPVKDQVDNARQQCTDDDADQPDSGRIHRSAPCHVGGAVSPVFAHQSSTSTTIAATDLEGSTHA